MNIYIMKLVIVESPSKAKTIEKYLGDDFKVVSSVGHIRELPKNESKAINIESDFKPCYEVIKGKEKSYISIKIRSKRIRDNLSSDRSRLEKEKL